MEELLELIIDFSNTFGSVIQSLRMRIRDYRSLIRNSHTINSIEVNYILSHFPIINEELHKNKKKTHIVLVDNVKVKSFKATISVVFLDENIKYVHSFSILTESNLKTFESFPFYWIA